MTDENRVYPDNAAIHLRKAQWRGERAKLSFVQKLDALDELRARVEPIVRAREARKQAKGKTA